MTLPSLRADTEYWGYLSSILQLSLFTPLCNYEVLLAHFQAVATVTSWDSSSICLSSDCSTFPFIAPGTEKNWVRRKTGQCFFLCSKASAKAFSCACGTGRVDAGCRSGLSQQKTWEGRRFWWIWSTWWCKASLNNFENINWWKIETGSKKCTQFLSSLLCLQYHLVEIDVACHGLNRQGACNPKCSYGTQKDRIFWKNS